ncbi:hypothetical protein AgCh_031977 [Apium graveolens]
MRDIVELIRGCLAAAQDPQRKYADLARKDREYEVGDQNHGIRNGFTSKPSTASTQGQECQAIQSLIETSQGRGVDLGIREPPARKTTSMDQTRTVVLRRVRNAREFRRLFVRQPRKIIADSNRENHHKEVPLFYFPVMEAPQVSEVSLVVPSLPASQISLPYSVALATVSMTQQLPTQATKPSKISKSKSKKAPSGISQKMPVPKSTKPKEGSVKVGKKDEG